MMKRLLTPYYLYFLATALLTVTFTVLRTVFLFTDYDAAAQHYRTGGIELFVTYGALAAVVLLLVGVFFLPPKSALPRLRSDKTRYVLLLPALLFLVTAVEKLVLLAFEPLSALPILFLVLSALFAALAAVPFLVGAKPLPLSDSVSRLIGALPALFAIFYAMYLYFDESHYMNDPAAMLYILACVALALFFLYDAKEIGGEGTRLSLFFGATAAMLSLSAALPALLYRIVSGLSLASTLLSDLLLIAVAAVIAVRLLSYKTPSEKSL